MSNTAKYTEQYFINLFAFTQKGTIYAVQDGNHYRDESQAIQRCKDALLVGKILRYAVITADNCPIDVDGLNKMWRTVDQVEAPIVTETRKMESFDVDAARKAFEARKKQLSSVDAPKEVDAPKKGRPAKTENE